MLQSVAFSAGTGKSHLAAALGHQACRRGHDVTFTTCSKLLPHLAGGHADRSFEARVRKLAGITVLIVNDFAMREFTAAQADDLYELLLDRGLDRSSGSPRCRRPSLVRTEAVAFVSRQKGLQSQLGDGAIHDGS
jgi:hypothetical protein